MKILIAEDQASSAVYLRRVLEKLGHDVRVARDGEQAWEFIQADHFPVVISDWMMPRMDGIDLCRRIRSRTGSGYVYVILLTARSEKEDRLAGLHSGADDFLVKPPDRAELAIRLEIAGRILAVQDELEQRNVLLAELADSDELTGAKNRRFFRRMLDLRFAEARVQGGPLSLVMLDIDHFKAYNDAFGHPAGDEVLRAAAGLLRDHVRGDDVVARIGGEEFVLILPGLAADPARALCERLTQALADHLWPLRRVSASLGVATLRPDTERPATLIDEADRALYHSKHTGRDRVTHFADLEPCPVLIE